MHGKTPADLLGRELDDDLRALNPEVSRTVSARLGRRRAAPGEPGVVQPGLDFADAGRNGSIVDNSGPLRNQIDPLAALEFSHRRRLQSFRRYRFAIVSRAERQI